MWNKYQPFHRIHTIMVGRGRRAIVCTVTHVWVGEVEEGLKKVKYKPE